MPTDHPETPTPLPRTVTLSDKSVWQYVEFAPLAGSSAPLRKWLRQTARGVGIPLSEPCIASTLTAADHRAIADVLEPFPSSLAEPPKPIPGGIYAGRSGMLQLLVDHTIPPGEIQLRAQGGRVLGRITGLSTEEALVPSALSPAEQPALTHRVTGRGMGTEVLKSKSSPPAEQREPSAP